MIKDHAEIERVLKSDLDSIELYFSETRKTVVNALSAIGDYYDKSTEMLEQGEKLPNELRDLRELSQEVSLTLAVALRNIEFGLDTSHHLHKCIDLPHRGRE